MPTQLTDPRAGAWLDDHTYRRSEDTNELVVLKDAEGCRISVCLPALNEAGTVGAICSVISERLMGARGLVDELIVIDSGSTDGTRTAAAASGARVLQTHPALSDIAPGASGKGVALWSSLAYSSGDIVVWLDADTKNFSEHFVTQLVGPLLRHRELKLVKAFYERPLQTGDGYSPAGGGRVTELVVRPLLNIFCPQLSGVIQPLAGECAVRRDAVSELSFVTGYGVEVAMLIDVVERWGLDALAQADLGVRVHRNRELLDLGRMSFDIVHTMLGRFEDLGLLKAADPLNGTLAQFQRGAVEILEASETDELPPLAAVLPEESPSRHPEPPHRSR